MAKTRAIIKRHKAVKNIRKITRTMELIATARFKKAMDRATEADAFTRRVAQLVADLSKTEAAARHPLLEEHAETNKSLLLVLTSNRGLCGGYNANVLRVGSDCYDSLVGEMEVDLEVSGKRGVTFCKHRHLDVSRSYLHFEDKPTFDEVEELADRYIELFQSGQIDRFDVAYTKFISRGQQKAVVETLLPMSQIADDEDEAESEDEEKRESKREVDYEFMPSAEDILNEIVPVSFKVKLFKCFLDAAVSEQIIRMVAMKGATENAGNLMKSLKQQYNRARQSQITSELAEIIGTAEALK